jgi:hypothetical protein
MNVKNTIVFIQQDSARLDDQTIDGFLEFKQNIGLSSPKKTSKNHLKYERQKTIN